MNDTHYDVIEEVSNEGWNFNQIFLRELMHPRNEYVDKHPLAYALGAEVEETGKHFCSHCDKYFTDPACSRFEEILRQTLRREVIEPHMEKHCPECEEELEDTEMVNEVDMSRDAFKAGEEMEITQPDINKKTRYNPCGCLFEVGEEEILWDLDKEKVREEVSLLNYNGRIFDS